MKLVAGTWFGVETLIGGAGVVLAGIFTHLLVSAGWGAVFGLLLPRRASMGVALIAGVLYAAVVLLVMTYIVLPWLDPVMRERVDLTWSAWLVTHAVFGTVLALVPVFRRKPAGR